MTSLTQSIEAVTEYLRQFDRLRDTGGKIHGVATDPANPDGVDLLAADLHRVLDAAAREADREPKPGAPYVEGQMVIDGRPTQFLLMGDTGSVQFTQWGADQITHGERVDYVKAMRDALVDEGFYYDTDEGELTEELQEDKDLVERTPHALRGEKWLRATQRLDAAGVSYSPGSAYYATEAGQ